MKPIKTFTALVLALAMALVLAACGGGANSSSGSSASSETSSSSESASPASSSSAAAKDAAEQAPSVSYMPAKIDITYNNDNSKITSSYTFDDHGRQQAISFEMVSPTSTYVGNSTITDWDEYGHLTKIVETADDGDGKSFKDTIEVTAQELNADGTLASSTRVTTFDKDSFEEGEAASIKETATWDYGDDVQVCRKSETKAEYFDKSGALMMSRTQTNEYDENGLQTRFAYKAVYADGAELNLTAEITWTKDADGKPISYKLVCIQDGEDTSTSTGEVKTDESGLISWIGNVEVDGEAVSTKATIDRVKINNPLPNAYEGWKSFALTDVVLELA